MIQVNYEEGKELVKKHVCSECEGPLSVAWGGAWQIDGYIVRCGRDPEHTGLIETATLTQAARRGGAVDIFVGDNINKRMLPAKADLERLTAIIEARYPQAELDGPTAALFVLDCWRLDLDPLLGEIVPVTFNVKKKVYGKADEWRKVVVPIITIDGTLSLAARACPERWAGPPSCMPVTDADMKEAICGEADAWVWEAKGKVKDGATLLDTAITWGWFKKSEETIAKERKQPSGELPGNQARVRAIKRWVRENFPEAKQKMIALTSELMGRAEGVKQALDVIEGEYKVISSGTTRSLPKGKERIPRDVSVLPSDEPNGPGPQPGPANTPAARLQELELDESGDPPREKMLTITQLYAHCNKRWGMQPAQVNGELGVGSQADLVQTPWECYKVIKEIREPALPVSS